MRSLFLLAVVLAVAAGPAASQQPSAARKSDLAAETLAKLRKPVDLPRFAGTLNEYAELLSQKTGISILIDAAAFREVNGASELDMSAPSVKGLSLLTALPRVLSSIDATYLVFKDHLEIVPVAFAAKKTKNVEEAEEAVPARMAQPLVSMIFKEKPLNEAVAELAEDYNLTVVVLPQSGDARTGFVTARLFNVPADRALEILALQADLRVVRNANAFMITSRDHANDLLGEKLDHERQVIEVEKFRAAPYMPPQPQPPQPQPQPAANPPAPGGNPPPPPKP